MRLFSISLFLLNVAVSFAQPSAIGVGMKRNAVQTLMGKTKINLYEKTKTVYSYPDSIFLTFQFDVNEMCTGFSWFSDSKKEFALRRAIENFGWLKQNDSTYTRNNPISFLKQNKNYKNIEFIYESTEQKLLQVSSSQTTFNTASTLKRKPFYGFSILGYKVWEKKEKTIGNRQ